MPNHQQSMKTANPMAVDHLERFPIIMMASQSTAPIHGHHIPAVHRRGRQGGRTHHGAPAGALRAHGVAGADGHRRGNSRGMARLRSDGSARLARSSRDDADLREEYGAKDPRELAMAKMILQGKVAARTSPGIRASFAVAPSEGGWMMDDVAKATAQIIDRSQH